MAPTVTRQRQEANTKSAMTFFPFFPESSDSSYFKTTDEIERLKMVIKSSVLIREKTTTKKKPDNAVSLLPFNLQEVC